MVMLQRLAPVLLLFSFTTTLHAQTPDVLRLARHQVAQGQYALAAAQLEPLGLDALSPEGAHLLGRCYQAMLQHERAVAAFVRADTTAVPVRIDWAQSLERLGLPEQAERHYRTAYRADSSNQHVAASYARLLADRNAWTEVAAIYEHLVARDTLNSYLHAQLGTAYAQLDSTDRAIIHYQRAHGLNPRNVRVVLALTKIYYNIAYIHSAERVLASALAERPHNAALWRRSGEVFLKKEAYPEAIDAFRNVLLYAPDSSAQDLSNLGVGYYLTEQFDDALPLLQRSFEKNDEESLNAFYLGMTYQQLEQYDEALHYLNHAADLLSKGMLADIYARIGNTYEQADQEPEAIRTYRLALTLDAERVEVLFHLAALYDVYYADKNMALEQFERFLARVGENQLPQMQRYAQQRVQELREALFFEQGRTAPRAGRDSIVIQPPDSSGMKEE